jgi:hypothetical protein
MNVVEKPDAIINVKIILNGLCRNTVWELGGIHLAEDIDQWWDALRTTIKFTQNPQSFWSWQLLLGAQHGLCSMEFTYWGTSEQEESRLKPKP